MNFVRSSRPRCDAGRLFARRRAALRAFALVLACAAIVCAFPAVFTSEAAADTRPYIGDRYGISREDIVRWLKSHENDYYYIGTPYGRLAYTAPNGDPNCVLNPGYSTGGQPLMNCAGFVAHVVYKCGLDVDKWNGYLAANHPALYNRQNYNLASADMWYLHVTGDNTGLQGDKELTGAFRYYSFPSLTEALRSGRMRKGDLFIFWPKEGYAKDRVYQDSHIGVYWGDTPGENKFWHMLWPYCKIDAIYSFKGPYDFIVIPFSEYADSGTLTVTEKNARGETLSGAKFSVRNTTTGDSYVLGPTGGDGTASIFLPMGEYTVRPSKYPYGYAEGFESSWTVTINKKKTTYINADCDLPAGTVEITQTDENGKGVAGTKFTAVRVSDKRSKEIAATDASGKTKVQLPPGTYTVTQTQSVPSLMPKDKKEWTVTVESYRTVTLNTYAVPARGSFGIRVVDADGEGVPGVIFEVRDTPDLAEDPIDEVMTDMDGVLIYGFEGGKHLLDYADSYYFTYAGVPYGNYIGIGGVYHAAICGGETVWLGGDSITLLEKSTIVLGDDMPEGTYHLYKDEQCVERATVPSEDFAFEVEVHVSQGEELVVGAGKYYLRREGEAPGENGEGPLTYAVTATAGETTAVSAESAFRPRHLRHTFGEDSVTARNEKGFVMRLCEVCGEFVLLGDVNSDGSINARDVMLMMRALAGADVSMDDGMWDVVTDGKLNAKDVTALMRQMIA